MLHYSEQLRRVGDEIGLFECQPTVSVCIAAQTELLRRLYTVYAV